MGQDIPLGTQLGPPPLQSPQLRTPSQELEKKETRRNPREALLPFSIGGALPAPPRYKRAGTRGWMGKS